MSTSPNPWAKAKLLESEFTAMSPAFTVVGPVSMPTFVVTSVFDVPHGWFPLQSSANAANGNRKNSTIMILILLPLY
jgi:hypothetical protein